MKIKQRREESGREHSLFLSLTIWRGEFLRQRHRHGQQQHPRQMPASLDWFSLRKTIGDPGGVCWTSQCARPQRCLVYIIYIQSRSQCQLCECVCVCLCVYSICECIRVCVPHWRQHILAALSERSHIESAKVIFIYIYIYIVHISMHARL